MNILDLWTEENLWLSVGDICKKLKVKVNKGWDSNYKNIFRMLKKYVDLGLFIRKKELRTIRHSGNGKGERMVYIYTPKLWILHSVCDGFYERGWEKLKSGF